MRVALVYSDIYGAGGYPRDARWLAAALKRKGIDITVFGGRRSPTPADGLDAAIDQLHWKTLFWFANEFDLVHIFGLFLLNHPLIASLVTLNGVPLVVSPMGHLMPHALGIRTLRKRLFLDLAWRPALKRSVVFHVFSQLEAESVQRWVRHARYFLGGLGVFPTNIKHRAEIPSLSQRSIRKFLFLGRNDIHQKGLDILLEAFAKALKSRDFKTCCSMRLTIAGQPWRGSTALLEKTICELQLRDTVRIIGSVDEQTKWRLLTEADYLVFLSRWDGPPRPIREAIAVGTPVVVSSETNLGEMVDKFGAGLHVTLQPEAVAKALLRAALEDNLLDKCRQGVEQLRTHLAWDRVAEDYIDGYKGVLCKS